MRAFFCGQELTKFVTHTSLVLIPKKEIVRGFTNMRPIILSSFANKIISQVIYGRISRVLSKIISQNQAGFV